MARKPIKYKNSQRQEERIIKNNLSSKGLRRFPYTSVSADSLEMGVLGIGKLKLRDSILDLNPSTEGPSGKPFTPKNNVIRYKYFFIKRENPSVSGSGDPQYFFYIIKAIKEITHAECSDQSGIARNNITPLNESDYLNGFFSHPKYINDTYSLIKVRYAEIATLEQTMAGRMDNIPFGYPDFNYNPSIIVTQTGQLPSKPYVDFYLSGFAKGATGVSAQLGDSVLFLDNSVKTPPQVRPSSWEWEFGSYATPTGSTAQNPVVTYTQAGVYDVKLTASNTSGSTSITKISYITIN